MSPLRLAGLLLLLIVAGCARPPDEGPVSGGKQAMLSRMTSVDMTMTAAIAPQTPATELGQPRPPFVARPDGTLAGRTLSVGSAAEIALAPGEIVLTFDDGPRPGRTDRILDALDAYGVKATFLMVGRMAAAHPGMAQQVALRGHTIGTHTFDHANLADAGHDVAIEDIRAGQAAVEKALAPIGRVPDPFFRFPYLAQTRLLKSALVSEQTIVLGVDIDSKDYYDTSAEDLLARTLDRIEARGRGVVLFHDVHARTVAMLPELLQSLQERGYRVVTLRARGDSPFDRDLIMAGATPAVPPTTATP